MSTLFLGNHVQFFDDNGEPLSGGEVDFFEVGTSTPKDVYTDADLSTPASNPVTLDSAGRATIWLNGDYKVRVKDSAGAAIRTTDGINPPVDTETSGGNLIANGSFEKAGNASTDADGWTLTAQSDGTVERVTTDNYDGEACLKFTSDGSGGGQADTDAFFAVSPGRTYGVSFALKCSVADIRNIVQVRYFDKDQVFLSNSTVYDEDTSNPTSWTIKQFSDTPPANARFAKVRILGADQSDATAGEAKFDSVSIATGGLIEALTSYATARVELGQDFDAGEEVVCERFGNTVTIRGSGALNHDSTFAPTSPSGVIPPSFRPSDTTAVNVFSMGGDGVDRVTVLTDGTFQLRYHDWTGGDRSETSSGTAPTVTFVITGNIT